MSIPTTHQLRMSLLLLGGLLVWCLALVLMLVATAAILDTLRAVVEIADISPDIPLPIPTAGA